MPSNDAEKAVAFAEMELEYRVQLFNRCVYSSPHIIQLAVFVCLLCCLWISTKLCSGAPPSG